MITPQSQKRMIKLDNVLNFIRHITEALCRDDLETITESINQYQQRKRGTGGSDSESSVTSDDEPDEQDDH